MAVLPDIIGSARVSTSAAVTSKASLRCIATSRSATGRRDVISMCHCYVRAQSGHRLGGTPLALAHVTSYARHMLLNEPQTLNCTPDPKLWLSAPWNCGRQGDCQPCATDPPADLPEIVAAAHWRDALLALRTSALAHDAAAQYGAVRASGGRSWRGWGRCG